MKNDYNNYQLCYVDRLDDFGAIKLWFSDLDVSNVWGDDWDDKPYEHNAGEPYDVIDSEIINKYIKIIIELNDKELLLPCSGTINSNFSVEDINIRKQIPWLRNNKFNLWAGTSLEETLKILKTLDIEIYYDSKLIGE